MLLSSNVIVNAVLLVLGGVWCKVVCARIPRDLAEFKAQDWSDRTPIVVIWVVTAGLLLWILGAAWSVGAGILSAF